MNEKIDAEIQERISWLLEELRPMADSEDYMAYPHSYKPENDTLYLEIMPYAPSEWADIAYDFANKDGIKYDREYSICGIDGQPRVSYSGLVWVRFVSPFKDGATLGQNIWADLWTHDQAEDQLTRYSGSFCFEVGSLVENSFS
jgi:hypothetical protein